MDAKQTSCFFNHCKFDLGPTRFQVMFHDYTSSFRGVVRKPRFLINVITHVIENSDNYEFHLVPSRDQD